jgi:two-component system, NarL family, invasion response regulator UvrY
MDARPGTKRIGKVLIVDDCAQMRQAIRSTVEDLAEEILEAEDGGKAIAAYLQHKPDWVTMDLSMRPVDGLTAVREIRSRDARARILIVTVHNTKAFREAAWLAGASGYVLKDDLGKIRDEIDPAGASPGSSTKSRII